MGTFKIDGRYTSATVFTTNNTENKIDDYAIAQLQMLCDTEANEGCPMVVMPDVHPGKVGTIGLTMTVGEKIMPNIVGIDIGCGMSLAQVKGKIKEFQKLDTVIRDSVPAGYNIRTKVHHLIEDFNFERLACRKHIDINRALLSAGSLGGGNHFIEVDQDAEKNYYLVIHSGSRHLGKEVTDYYLNLGQKTLKENGITVPFELTYLEGNLRDDYLADLQIVQEYASLSREIMIAEICKGMKWKIIDQYQCIHNYVDASADMLALSGAPILRKGAISAKVGEKVIIPINMKDGIILGTGRGNPEWNYSAPHGSGRIMKREEIKQTFTLSSYKSAMKGIYSPSICKETLDEAPFAYRNIDDIANVIGDTVTIENIISPIYNFKAGGDN